MLLEDKKRIMQGDIRHRLSHNISHHAKDKQTYSYANKNMVIINRALALIGMIMYIQMKFAINYSCPS